MSNIEQRPVIDEETALLSDVSGKRKTPLPKLQIAILLTLHLCEPITSNSIFPYINQLIVELDITGGDQRKVGYYAGLVTALYFAAEAATVLQWGRISDHVGRKPVLLVGLAGNALSMICFGISRTFTTLVISRCLCGLLNGNIGVMKSVMGELLDTTNRVEGFSLLPAVWSVGATIGPMMGGALSRPHERFPAYFGGQFWKEYPYFLSCLGAAIFVFISFLLTLLFFEETLPKYYRPPHSSSVYTTTEESKPLPLRQLLTYPVIMSVSNYVILAFIEIMFIILVPLFMAMPIEIGGLGCSPMVIGYVLGALGAYIGLFQWFFFAKLVRRFGEKRIFIMGLLTFVLNSTLLPLTSIVARQAGVTWVVWSLLAFSLSLFPIMDMCYSCIFIYIIASSPNKNSLGATNGISQTIVSIARAIGPALATSLFSFSVENNILGGYVVYVILFVLSCLALLPALRLPSKPWDVYDD
ncbi:hypothetical protein AX15_002723 [Amanita polypyramis BW_CC]|nr:hypothetical protein AX15_002723 [Amanita polypyramis BW_CC]